MHVTRWVAGAAEEIVALTYALEREAAEEGLEITDAQALQAAAVVVAAWAGREGEA